MKSYVVTYQIPSIIPGIPLSGILNIDAKDEQDALKKARNQTGCHHGGHFTVTPIVKK